MVQHDDDGAASVVEDAWRAQVQIPSIMGQMASVFRGVN
jgi:hypothetical protein